MSFLSKKITIVIPSKNEGIGLVNTVKHIIDIDPNIKIIISDTHTDNTPDIIKELFKKIHHKNNKIIYGGLPSVARNNGANFVKTPYVLFLDADINIENVDLVSIINKMERDGLELGTVRITTSDIKYKLIYMLFDIVQMIVSKKTPFAVGGFMLFKTDVFKKLNGFDVDDKFAEDYHLSSKVKPNKFKIFNYYAITSPRRFKNKGIFYMIKLMIRCWFNRNNDDFYKQDYNYWD